MNIKRRIGRIGFGILLLIVVAVALAPQSSALPAYSIELQNVYGNGSCVTCHLNSSGGGDLTGYGNKFAGQSNHAKYPAVALRAIGAPPVSVPIKMSMFVLALQGLYGNGSCTTCHVTSSGGEFTEYGKKFSAQPGHDNEPIAAIKAIGPPGVVMGATTTGETVSATTTGGNTGQKSPGFEIVVTIGIISAVYILRKNKML